MPTFKAVVIQSPKMDYLSRQLGNEQKLTFFLYHLDWSNMTTFKFWHPIGPPSALGTPRYRGHLLNLKWDPRTYGQNYLPQINSFHEVSNNCPTP